MGFGDAASWTAGQALNKFWNEELKAIAMDSKEWQVKMQPSYTERQGDHTKALMGAVNELVKLAKVRLTELSAKPAGPSKRAGLIRRIWAAVWANP